MCLMALLRHLERALIDRKIFTMQFEKVWGAASTTAQKWYDEGCRTLEDVRNRTDLTTQQVWLPMFELLCSQSSFQQTCLDDGLALP